MKKNYIFDFKDGFLILNSTEKNDFFDFQKENASFYKSLDWERGIAFTYDPSTHYDVIDEFFTRICENIEYDIPRHFNAINCLCARMW